MFGNPRRIITDRGTAFTAQKFEKHCEENKIELHHIATGVPRGNGQVERIHRVIIPMITKLAIEKPEEWYKHVPKVQKHLNQTYQRSIDCSPFELMIGVKMRDPADIHLTSILEEEFRNEFIESRDEMRRHAKQQILKVQAENKRTYDKRRKPPRKYHVGDLVAIEKTQFGTGQKVKPKFLGPYEVSSLVVDFTANIQTNLVNASIIVST
uniref:Integrase catalytic domain-containing protein n=1 Tax=Phlebotomus papatasi TaxID=29031 RepID=A0A1B0DPN9_PHLPP